MRDQVSEYDIEQKLNSTFKLIEPDPDFVRKLGHRLIWQPVSIVIEEIQPNNIRILAGLLLIATSAIIIWMVQRAYRLKP